MPEAYPKWIHSALLGHDLIVNSEEEHRKHLTTPEPVVSAPINKDSEAELFDAVPTEFLDPVEYPIPVNVIVEATDPAVVVAGVKRGPVKAKRIKG